MNPGLTGKKEDDFVSGVDDRVDFRLMLTHHVRKIVAHKMSNPQLVLAMVPNFI